MGIGEWLVIIACNVMLIGVGVLVYTGKLDSRLMPRRKFVHVDKYHKWALAVCVVTALLLDLWVVLLVL